jgi:copper chaperone
MPKLSVPDMSCGHCEATVTKAIRSVDETAKVDVDLTSRAVAIESTADMLRIISALEAEGYPSQPV